LSPLCRYDPDSFPTLTFSSYGTAAWPIFDS
jgi:hypothetical protein